MTTPDQYRTLVRRTRPLRQLKRAAEVSLFAIWRFLIRRPLDHTRHDAIISEASYAPWKLDADFGLTVAAVRNATVVDRYRLWELWCLTHQLRMTDGDILEVGTWRGGSGCLIATRSQLDDSAARVLLCDTFAGVVKASARDGAYTGGEFADTSAEHVKALAASMGLYNVDVHVGTFPDDTGAGLADRHIKLCHIDVDTHGSAKAVTDWVWPRLVPGGIIVFDDYGFADTPGVTAFVEEMPIGQDRRVFHNLNGHAIVVRVCPTPTRHITGPTA